MDFFEWPLINEDTHPAPDTGLQCVILKNNKKGGVAMLSPKVFLVAATSLAAGYRFFKY